MLNFISLSLSYLFEILCSIFSGAAEVSGYRHYREALGPWLPPGQHGCFLSVMGFFEVGGGGNVEPPAHQETPATFLLETLPGGCEPTQPRRRADTCAGRRITLGSLATGLAKIALKTE